MATFNFATYLKNGFLGAVGKKPDYWIILNSSGYYEKGVFTDEDMAEIALAIEEKNARLEAEEQARLEAEQAAKEEAEKFINEQEDSTDDVLSGLI
ncbi:MAG: hypothetical protein J6A05_04635 [Oscillospiraceae bacterium]|nr:hypothetical protein [Oscillospiraceae bacterium]